MSVNPEAFTEAEVHVTVSSNTVAGASSELTSDLSPEDEVAVSDLIVILIERML